MTFILEIITILALPILATITYLIALKFSNPKEFEKIISTGNVH